MNLKTSVVCFAVAAAVSQSPLLSPDDDEPALSSHQQTIAELQPTLVLQTAGPFGGERRIRPGKRARGTAPHQHPHPGSGDGHRPRSGGGDLPDDAPDLNAGGATRGLLILVLGTAIAFGRRQRANTQETINE